MLQKTKSSAVSKAEARVAALKQIAAAADLGPGLTLAVYEKALAEARAALDAYNGQVAAATAVGIEFRIQEGELAEFSKRMLKGVGARFGTDSAEYGKAGAVRKSDRRRPTRQPKA